MGRRMVLGLALVMTGCASQGVKVPQTEVLHWEKGRSTCYEIVARYGPPTSEVRSDDGLWTLTYDYRQGQQNMWYYIPLGGLFAGTTSEFTQATFVCDTQGILRASSSSQGQNKTGTGPFSGQRQ